MWRRRALLIQAWSQSSSIAALLFTMLLESNSGLPDAPQARGLSYDDYYAEWRKAATPVPASDWRKGVRQTKLRAMRAPPPLTLLASSKTRK